MEGSERYRGVHGKPDDRRPNGLIPSILLENINSILKC